LDPDRGRTWLTLLSPRVFTACCKKNDWDNAASLRRASVNGECSCLVNEDFEVFASAGHEPPVFEIRAQRALRLDRHRDRL